MPSLTPLHEPFCNLRKSPLTQGDFIEGLAQLATTGIARTTDFVQAIYRETILRSLGVYDGQNPTPLQQTMSEQMFRAIRLGMKFAGPYTANGLRLIGRMSSKQTQKPLYVPTHVLTSALNGVMGDHLVYDCNPLALPMLAFDRHNKVQTGPLAGRVVIFVHGLCMTQHSWYPSRYMSMGEQVYRQQDCTVLYLSYNTGRRISLNGRSFSNLLNDLYTRNPDITQIDIIGHSMGGLVSRSALFYGKQMGLNWILLVDHLICLGSPHQGALLERLSFMLQEKVGKLPFAGMLARLGDVRSAGIIDLRWGSVRDDDWEHLSSGRRGDFADNRRPAPLPSNIKAYFVAGTLEHENVPSKAREALGDYLVSVKSALGEHDDPEHSLNVPAERKKVLYGVDHMQLQYSQRVIDVVLKWMAPPVKIAQGKAPAPVADNVTIAG